jgi:hypothetical protein
MSNISSEKTGIAPKQREELPSALKARFEKNMTRHKGLEWPEVQTSLEAKSWKIVVTD